MFEEEQKPWPSTIGPSIFISDARFQSPRWKLYLKLQKVEAGIEWEDFQVVANAVGRKEFASWFKDLA